MKFTVPKKLGSTHIHRTSLDRTRLIRLKPVDIPSNIAKFNFDQKTRTTHINQAMHLIAPKRGANAKRNPREKQGSTLTAGVALILPPPQPAAPCRSVDTQLQPGAETRFS